MLDFRLKFAPNEVFLDIFLSERENFSLLKCTQVTYGKGLPVYMQKLVFGAYLPGFTSEKSKTW